MIKNNIAIFKVILSLTILCGAVACSSKQAPKRQVLRHIVSLQFKEEVSEEEKAQAIKIFLDLKDEIPEIKKIEGGANVSQGSQDKFTHCFVLTFESEEARDIYLPHPAHMRVVEANKPLFSDLLVVDFWGEE